MSKQLEQWEQNIKDVHGKQIKFKVMKSHGRKKTKIIDAFVLINVDKGITVKPIDPEDMRDVAQFPDGIYEPDFFIVCHGWPRYRDEKDFDETVASFVFPEIYEEDLFYGDYGTGGFGLCPL